jgi:CheY-like chemotaxis protein
VLVVDDVHDSREMYAEYLRFVGYRVAEASDGEAAIELARNLRPSVILMDLSMPGVDGWEATRLLKADPTTKEILIIALSAHAEEASQVRAAAVGCDWFIAKPSLPADVARCIAHVLDRAAGAAR